MSTLGNVPAKNILHTSWMRCLLGFCFWTVIGLAFGFQFYISSAKAGMEVTWKQAVSYALGDWYVFAALSIPVIWLTRRFRLDSGRRARDFAIHFPASLLFSPAYMDV